MAKFNGAKEGQKAIKLGKLKLNNVRFLELRSTKSSVTNLIYWGSSYFLYSEAKSNDCNK